MKIAIIDTKVDINHKCFNDVSRSMISVNDQFYKCNNKNEDEGHGTAVCNLLLNGVSLSTIAVTVFPLFSGVEDVVEEENLYKYTVMKSILTLLT